MTARAALCLVFCLACASPIGQLELAQRVVAALEVGWERAGLPEPVEGCRLDEFAVEFPTAEDFAVLCPEKAWACLAIWEPVAFINPAAKVGQVKGLAIHEGMHWLAGCTRGDRNVDHTDPDIWEKKGTPVDAAEEYAREEMGRHD